MGTPKKAISFNIKYSTMLRVRHIKYINVTL